MTCPRCGNGPEDHVIAWPSMSLCIDRGGGGIVLSLVDCFTYMAIIGSWFYFCCHALYWVATKYSA